MAEPQTQSDWYPYRDSEECSAEQLRMQFEDYDPKEALSKMCTISLAIRNMVESWVARFTS